ncbi:MAG: DNA topoisomerase 3 [Bacillota bacterium]
MTRKPLIIAEKPSAARAIADALGGFSAREGYLESSRYYLSWAIGHLVELRSPEEYDPRWKRWSLDSLPIMPEAFQVKVVGKTRSQFQVLARLGKTASELINACDAGREGELIFRYICEAASLRAPVRRLWVSALTREAIRKAFGQLQPGAAYDRLYQSARCRAEGDWLMGMNATRAFTVKWGELFSVGRVQTPTLALLVKRQREIEAFKPEPYWEVHGEFATDDRRQYPGKWFGPDGDRLTSAEAAEAIAARVKGRPGLVESVEEKPASERPPQLYDLTSLQREANRRFGLTAAATLKAAQSLYESKLITYPRTDSRHLSRDLVKTLPGIVRNLGGQAEFAQAAAGVNLDLVHPGNRRVVDDGRVTDHHAIIPTAEAPRSLSGAEAKIYGLIARRFLAQFYPEARFLDTEVITRVEPHPDRFKSRGRRVLDPGWTAVEPQAPSKKGEEEETAVLPGLRSGEPVTVKKVTVAAKETQPPKRYTEASLLAAMESAGKAMDDEELKEAMKGRGLGTPATRAAIIERLKDVGYIALEKKSLVPTPKGRQLVERAEAIGAQVLLSAELTGEWEKRIADIQAGEYQPTRFMAEIRELASSVIGLVRQAPGPVARGGRSGPRQAGLEPAGEEPTLPAGRCPLCGSEVTRQGRDWKCSGPSCPTRIPTWLCGLVIDQALAQTLLTKGRSAVLSGFTSPRTGKAFRASLVLKEGKVEFEFPTDRPVKGKRSTRRAQGERTTTAQTGSRKAGGGTGVRAGTKAGRAGGSRVGRGASGASKPARTGPERD